APTRPVPSSRRSRRRRPTDDDRGVSELVPEEAAPLRVTVRLLEERARCERLEQREVTGIALVHAGEETVDHSQLAPRVEHEIRLASSRAERAPLGEAPLERPDDARPDGDHAPSERATPLDGSDRLRGYLVTLRKR